MKSAKLKMTQLSLEEGIWDWLHKKSVRITHSISAIHWHSWKMQRWLYYKWAKLYTVRIQGEWNDEVQKEKD